MKHLVAVFRAVDTKIKQVYTGTVKFTSSFWAVAGKINFGKLDMVKNIG